MEPTRNDIVPNKRTHYGNMMYAEAVTKRHEKFARAANVGNEGLKREQARKVLAEVRKLKPPGRFLYVAKERGKYGVLRDEKDILAIIIVDLERDNYYLKTPSTHHASLPKVPSTRRGGRTDKNPSENDEYKLLIQKLLARKVTSEDNAANKNPIERVMMAAQKELTLPVKPSEERKKKLLTVIKGLSEKDPFITSVVENEMKLALEPRAPERWKSVKALEHTVDICCNNED